MAVSASESSESSPESSWECSLESSPESSPVPSRGPSPVPPPEPFPVPEESPAAQREAMLYSPIPPINPRNVRKNYGKVVEIICDCDKCTQ